MVVSGIERLLGNAQLAAIPDRLLAADLLVRHEYYYCYCCCRRYLSQTVADGAAAFPMDDRTESRNFSLVDCNATVLLLQVRVGTPDVEEL